MIKVVKKEVLQKLCNGFCGQEKPLDEFSPDPKGLLGRRADCKACRNLRDRKRKAGTLVNEPKATQAKKPAPLKLVEKPKPQVSKYSQEQLLRGKAAARAMRRLVDKHPKDFDELLKKEMWALNHKPAWHSITDLMEIKPS